MLVDLHLIKNTDIPIAYCDNQTVISNIKSQAGSHGVDRAIGIRYQFLSEKYESGYFKLLYVNTADNIADGLTKSLSPGMFKLFRESVNILPVPTHLLELAKVTTVITHGKEI